MGLRSTVSDSLYLEFYDLEHLGTGLLMAEPALDRRITTKTVVRVGPHLFSRFRSISFGQNSLLSLGLLSLTYLLWSRERHWLAGLVCSLVLYKPQLALGVGFLWLLEWRRDWQALAGLAVGGALLAGLSFGLLPESSRLYLELSRKVLPSIARHEGFPLWHAHTPRAFWLLLMPGIPALSETLALLSTGAGIVVFIFFWRKLRSEPALLFAGAICLTLWITPHAMIYDWTFY